MMSREGGTLPPGWVETTLDEVTTIRNEKIDPVNSAKKPYLSLEHIESGTNRIIDRGVSGDVKSTKSVFYSGDVLYGKLRPYLKKVCRPDFDGICSTDILTFAPSTAMDNGFLLGLLSRHETVEYANSHSKGINLPRISLTDLGKLEILLPPLNEQKRIVAKIEKLQARSRRAREALEAVPDLLDQLRQSVLAAAFRGDLTKEWRAKHPDVEPASELLKRIRIERRKRWEEAELEKLKAKGLTGEELDSEFAKRRKQYEEPVPVDITGLPQVPEGWCWIPAEHVVPVEAPIVYGIILPGSHVENGVPFIRPMEILNDVIVEGPIPCTSLQIAAKYERAKLQRGDIILSIVGTIGKVAVVPDRLNGANITQSSARVRPWLKFVSSEYLADALRTASKYCPCPFTCYTIASLG
jgi:type I restriction enzyme S subunit